MFTLLKYLFRNANQVETGALLDTRKVEEKVNDVHFKDIVATANAVNWVTKTSYRSFPQYDQKQSFMCGANALAKALGIAYSTRYGTYVPFSRADIYQRRINRPQAGMAMYDMFRIAGEGVTLEQLTPKTIWTDYDAESLLIENFKHEVGKVFAISGGVYLPADMETIASVIQTTGKGVILLIYFLGGEWSKEYPTIVNPSLTLNDPSSLHHFIVATDFGVENVGKVLKIDDSAAFGGLFDRKITNDWITKRVAGAGYPMAFKFSVGVNDRPSYDGLTIISAQKCLRFEGLFPLNVDYFESVGPTTRISLEAFQKKYGLTATKYLDEPTKAKLRTLYP
jgi:hypothetical protein